MSGFESGQNQGGEKGWDDREKAQQLAERLHVHRQEEAAEQKALLAEKLRRFRLERGMTATEVARRLGLSSSQVSKIELGIQSVPGHLLYAWAQIVGRTYNELFLPWDRHPVERGRSGPAERMQVKYLNMFADMGVAYQRLVYSLIESLHKIYRDNK